MQTFTLIYSSASLLACVAAVILGLRWACLRAERRSGGRTANTSTSDRTPGL